MLVYYVYTKMVLLRRERRNKRNSMISIRIPSIQHDFLRKNKISPTRIFDKAVRKVMRRKRLI